MFGCRRRRRRDEGFTLVEVLVAMGLVAGIMMAALPMLLSTLQSNVVTRTHTQAKNLSQQRLDQLRNLRFHVDRQNGPFLDLLDMYYTNAVAAGPSTTVSTGGGSLKGRYVATGSLGPGEPAGPYYRTETGPLAGAPNFSQVIATQFLAPDNSPVPASRFESRFDTQIAGKDQPPSLMLGVTVITSWTVNGTAKSYRAETRITDGRPQLPVIQSQSSAVAIEVSSTAVDGTTLALQAGVASLDGAQSNGSSVAGYATGAVAARTGQPAVTGQVGQFALPATPASLSGNPGAQSGGSACSWYGFGKSAVSGVSGDVSNGLPDAPNGINFATPNQWVSGHVEYLGGGSCGQLSYDNRVDGGAARIDAVGTLMGAAPYVRVVDTSGTGPSLLGAGYVTSNPMISPTRQTKSGARASTGQPVVLFPNTAESGGAGLVTARLISSRIDCLSGTAASNGSVTGSYSLELRWWGKSPTDSVARWHQAVWDYTSSSGGPVLAAGSDIWDPDNTLLSDGTRLSEVVTSSGVPTSVSTGSTTGLRGFPTGILTLTTAPTLSNEFSAGYSAINVQLGQLTCVADDLR